MKSSKKVLNLTDINVTSGTQMRVQSSPDTVERFARDMRLGDKFPDVTVVSDGKTNWMVDGFRRHEAAGHCHFTTIECQVYKGTLDDALRMAFGANAHHGDPRTDADKENAVRAACFKFTDRAHTVVAEICGVSTEYVRLQREVHAYPVAAKLIGKNGVAQAAKKSKRQPGKAIAAPSAQVAISQPATPVSTDATNSSAEVAAEEEAPSTDFGGDAPIQELFNPVTSEAKTPPKDTELEEQGGAAAAKISELTTLRDTLLEIALRVAERLTRDAEAVNRLVDGVKAGRELNEVDLLFVDKTRALGAALQNHC